MSAEAAIASIATSKANILISDIGMARADGYELLRRLRRSGSRGDASDQRRGLRNDRLLMGL